MISIVKMFQHNELIYTYICFNFCFIYFLKTRFCFVCFKWLAFKNFVFSIALSHSSLPSSLLISGIILILISILPDNNQTALAFFFFFLFWWYTFSYYSIYLHFFNLFVFLCVIYVYLFFTGSFNPLRLEFLII